MNEINGDAELLRQETRATYDVSATELAEYFRGIGLRTEDIDKAFALAGNPERARVLEIGCGDGRDATEIIERAGWYLGFDISASMIAIAHEKLPNVDFEVADAVSYNYPPDLDIVFAFASLLHNPREDVGMILDKVAEKIKPGGIFYISLKYAPEYSQRIQEDQFGRRLFYYYNPSDIESLAAKYYETASISREIKGETEWFELALRKK